MKIYMMSENYIIRVLFVSVLAIGLWAGCSRDRMDQEQHVDADKVLVRMRVLSGGESGAGALAASDVENDVSRVRIMIFTSEDDGSTGVPHGYVLVNKLYSDLGALPTQKITPGQRDFYIVANETPQMTARLERVTSVEQLKQIKVDYSTNKDVSFVMSQSKLNQTLVGGSTTEMNFSLVRVAAKVRFSLDFDAATVAAAGGLKDQPLQIDSIRILRVADSSNVVSQAPIYTAQRDKMSRLTLFSATDVATKWRVRDSLYIAERLFVNTAQTADTSLCTYMMIYANSNAIPCRYRINIGNVAGKGVTAPDYTITRNTQYNVVGTFTKLGETDGVDVSVTITPWTKIAWTDRVGVAPTITKVIEEFTTTSGRADFTMALDEKAYWEVKLENEDDFIIKGQTKNITGGDMGGTFNVEPRTQPVLKTTSTKVMIIVNGQTIDESTVTTRADFNTLEYKVYKLSSGVNSILIFDRNLGSESPMQAGWLYKFGGKVGVHGSIPSHEIPVTTSNPVMTYKIKEWNQMSTYEGIATVTEASVTSWGSITHQSSGPLITSNDPCPPGWRTLQSSDFKMIINAKFSAEAVKTYGTFAKGSVSGRILTDDAGNKQYFPVAEIRLNSDGRLGSSPQGYYWLSNSNIQNITESGSETSQTRTNGVHVRCCATLGQFNYTLTYPNEDDAKITVQRTSAVIETPLSQTEELVHYINVIDHAEVGWNLTGYVGSESWMKVEKASGLAGSGSGISGVGNGRIKVTIQPNTQTPLIGKFRPARQIELSLNNVINSLKYPIIVHQGGYITVYGKRWLDRNLMHGKIKSDDFDRVYPAAIPIGFPLNFVASTCSHAASGQTLEGFFSAGATNSCAYAGVKSHNAGWSDTSKTASDPCPKGWKVARANDYVSLNINSWKSYGSGELGKGFTKNTSSGRYEVINNQKVFLPACGAYYFGSFMWSISSGVCYVQADASSNSSQYYRGLRATDGWETNHITKDVLGPVRCVEAPEDK